MQKRFSFTRARLDKLPLPSGAWQYYYDVEQPRLAVGVGPSGAKTFYLVKKIAGRVERIKLERYGSITIDEAREATSTLLVSLASGQNPADGHRVARRGITLRAVFDDFIAHRRSRRGGGPHESRRDRRVESDCFAHRERALRDDRHRDDRDCAQDLRGFSKGTNRR